LYRDIFVQMENKIRYFFKSALIVIFLSLHEKSLG